ncbi:hypothetical protein Sjap_021859 [Stephania japonica]|uniref:Uncharacterized protein n=1 Tax=Stephania japonica TaxID=461633 RepID=A0AAP0ET27_9MAGN
MGSNLKPIPNSQSSWFEGDLTVNDQVFRSSRTMLINRILSKSPMTSIFLHEQTNNLDELVF